MPSTCSGSAEARSAAPSTICTCRSSITGPVSVESTATKDFGYTKTSKHLLYKSPDQALAEHVKTDSVAIRNIAASRIYPSSTKRIPEGAPSVILFSTNSTNSDLIDRTTRNIYRARFLKLEP